MSIGEIWEGPLGNRMVTWRVFWVGKKKARLSAQLEYGSCVATVFIDRVVGSIDWRKLSS